MTIIQVTAGGHTEEIIVSEKIYLEEHSIQEQLDNRFSECLNIHGIGGAIMIVPKEKIEMICIFDRELDISDVEKAINDGIEEISK